MLDSFRNIAIPLYHDDIQDQKQDKMHMQKFLPEGSRFRLLYEIASNLDSSTSP